MPLTLIQIQQLAERSDIPARDRLTYAILALHADCFGDVYARVRDIAAATGRETESTRRVLKRLRGDRHITSQREYREGRRISRWHINAVRGQAPAA